MLKLFKEEFLDNLKKNIAENIDYYQKESVWIGEYFGIDISEDDPPVQLIIKEKNNHELDYENTVRLYTALKNLSPAKASDERFWAYMTHVVYWDYMIARWPVAIKNDEDIVKAINFIKTHYFFGEKPYARNGIARLWWFGHVTYDSSLEDPFELTALMLKNQDQDISRMIMESPNIVRNRVSIQIILRSIDNMKKQGIPFKARDFVRYAAKRINFLGGVTVLEALDYEDINKLIESLIKKWVEENQEALVGV